MEVSREDVLRCAKLTDLHLREEEIGPMREAMTQLLNQAERLNELPLADVEPTSHGLSLELPRRADEVQPSFTQQEALANAPRVDRGHFEVPKVL